MSYYKKHCHWEKFLGIMMFKNKRGLYTYFLTIKFCYNTIIIKLWFKKLKNKEQL
jgi:hypothetical protein